MKVNLEEKTVSSGLENYGIVSWKRPWKVSRRNSLKKFERKEVETVPFVQKIINLISWKRNKDDLEEVVHGYLNHKSHEKFVKIEAKNKAKMTHLSVKMSTDIWTRNFVKTIPFERENGAKLVVLTKFLLERRFDEKIEGKQKIQCKIGLDSIH